MFFFSRFPLSAPQNARNSIETWNECVPKTTTKYNRKKLPCAVDCLSSYEPALSCYKGVRLKILVVENATWKCKDTLGWHITVSSLRGTMTASQTSKETFASI